MWLGWGEAKNTYRFSEEKSLGDLLVEDIEGE
jgi:hypothetical protein